MWTCRVGRLKSKRKALGDPRDVSLLLQGALGTPSVLPSWPVSLPRGRRANSEVGLIFLPHTVYSPPFPDPSQHTQPCALTPSFILELLILGIKRRGIDYGWDMG